MDASTLNSYLCEQVPGIKIKTVRPISIIGSKVVERRVEYGAPSWQLEKSSLKRACNFPVDSDIENS